MCNPGHSRKRFDSFFDSTSSAGDASVYEVLPRGFKQDTSLPTVCFVMLKKKKEEEKRENY